MSILSVQDISKSYKHRKVVKNLSVEIKSGEVVGLLGPNGAGKTTAFYMIVGLIAADSGNILLDGKDLTPQPMHRRAKLGLGYLPQEASIFRKLTVEQNILAILENRDDLDRAGREQELENLLDERIEQFRDAAEHIEMLADTGTTSSRTNFVAGFSKAMALTAASYLEENRHLLEKKSEPTERKRYPGNRDAVVIVEERL